MDVIKTLKGSVRQALQELNFALDQVHFEHPADFAHGDFSTNVALKIIAAERKPAKKKLTQERPTLKKDEAKELSRIVALPSKNPQELAEKIANLVKQDKSKEIEKVEVAGPGFINFHLSKDFFANSISDVLVQGDNWGKNRNLEGKKVMVEYTDPNPFKEFHIGHLMSNAIGESISRLIEFSSAEVKRANYYGDVGLHTAKAIWGKMEKPELSWGEAYVYGSDSYESNKSAIDEMNKKVYEKSDDTVNELYEEGKAESIANFEKIYEKLGTKFDFDFPESSTWEKGKDIVLKHKDVFEESDGATVFHGEKHGLHTRVFITSGGLPTYEAKELGLAKTKHEKYPYDFSVVITATEINEYFKVLLKAMEFVYPDLASKTHHIGHGFLKLPTGKMSSRKGNVITGESLINDVEELAKKKTSDGDVALKVAVAAIKYSILKQATGKDIIFDFEKSLSFEGASGPYLQYAHTRAHSVLEKAEGKLGDSKPPDSWNTTSLERLLYRFPEIVERAQKEYEPHYVTTYLTEIAAAFGNFYANGRILDTDENERSYKLSLVQAFQITMKNGLWLLGIEVPQHM